MKKNVLKTLILSAIVGLNCPLMAQEMIKTENTSSGNVDKVFTSFRTMSFGINGGTLLPSTAVSTRGDFSNYSFKPGYGFFLKQQIGHTLGFQADFLKGTLKGSNSGRIDRTTYAFETELNWSASLSTNLTFGNISFLNNKSAFLPYGGIGAGLINFTSSVAALKGMPLIANKQKRMLFIPVTIGTKIVLSNVINFDLGYKIGFVDSDKLDGEDANGDNDKFSYAFAGLEFILGKVSKPALGRVNPIKSITSQYDAKYDDLRKQFEDEKTNMANENARVLAENAKMLADQKRMMTDSDNDGVADYFDKCPNTPTTTKVDGAGCPLPSFIINKPADVKVYISEEDKKIVKDAIRNLEFDLGKASIRSTSFPSLDNVANLLVTKNFSLKLAGHTDNVGSNSANLMLSKDRAESVKAYLVSKGVNSSRVEATGYGKSQPIKTNKTPQGRQMNRRVEFTLY